MSLAQVELMCADTSVTIYPKTDTVKGSNGKEHRFSRPASSSIKEARKRFDSWDDVTNPTFDLSGFTFS